MNIRGRTVEISRGKNTFFIVCWIFPCRGLYDKVGTTLYPAVRPVPGSLTSEERRPEDCGSQGRGTREEEEGGTGTAAWRRAARY